MARLQLPARLIPPFKIPSLSSPAEGSRPMEFWGFEYKNLKTGPQSTNLFEPPADYEKFAMPDLGGMMKGFGGF